MAVGACVFLATTKAMSGRRMPTKTTSRSRISRAAAATMSSESVQAAGAEVAGEVVIQDCRNAELPNCGIVEPNYREFDSNSAVRHFRNSAMY